MFIYEMKWKNPAVKSQAVTCDVQQCGILTCVNSGESVQPPFQLINYK